jgi:hypothetical protein
MAALCISPFSPSHTMKQVIAVVSEHIARSTSPVLQTAPADSPPGKHVLSKAAANPL